MLLASATFQILNAALTDTREKVVSMAMTLLDQVVSKFSSLSMDTYPICRRDKALTNAPPVVFVEFCLQNEVPTSVSFRSLESIFALLLIRASDLNTRVRQGTLDRIVMLCNCFRSHPYSILPLVFKPARSTVLYRQAQARVEIVARLANEFGVYDGTAGTGTAGGLDFEVRKIFKRVHRIEAPMTALERTLVLVTHTFLLRVAM